MIRESKELFQISGEEERGQRARVADGGSEREPRRATQDSQGDQGDPSDGQKNSQATYEAGKREVTEKQILEPLFFQIKFLAVVLLRWLTLVVSLRITSP